MSEASSLTIPPLAGPRLETRQPPVETQTSAALPVAAKQIVAEAPGANAALKDTKLTVSLDAETGTFVYRSVSPVDGEVVWQWPSEQVMRVIQYFRRIENLDDRTPSRRSVDEIV